MDPFSFVDMIQIMESRELEETLFVGYPIVQMVAFNHDPERGLNCSSEASSEEITQMTYISNHTIKFRSYKTGRLLISNIDPFVVTKNVLKQKTKYHALFHKINTRKMGCDLKLSVLHSSYDRCPNMN